MAALTAHFESTETALPRSAKRHTLRLSVLAVSPTDGTAERVELLNLSERGFLLQSGNSFAQGDIVEIVLPEAGAVEAIVLWDNAPQFGCQFVTPLPKAVVSASVLRAPALQAVIASPATSAAEAKAEAAPSCPARAAAPLDTALANSEAYEAASDTVLSPRTKLAVSFGLAALCWAPVIAVVAMLRG